MIVLMGVVFWGLLNAWLSVFVFFATVPTFGEALFSGDWFHKIMGAGMWIVAFASWYYMLSHLTITVG
jgi:hypothetical protein